MVTTQQIMKKVLLLACLCAVFVHCKNNESAQSGTAEKSTPQFSTINTLTADEEKAGVKLLFDGKTMAGWHNFKKTTIGSGWVVDTVERAIHLDAKRVEGKWQALDAGDIVTADEYENFELSVDWKIDTCGNSGIIYNVIENTTDSLEYVWHSGPEMQVLDNACHPDAKIIKHRAGDLYDLISSSKEPVRPALQWNQARLIINKGHVEHWLNGEKIVEFQFGGKEWDALVAGSKFKAMPMFGKAKKGHIALQDHGNKVWFRNMKIKVL